MKAHRLRKVVIPAAGLGTRFLPATKAQPKEMLPIFDVPGIQLVVEEAVKAGVRDVILITGRNKQAIENHFDKSLELEHFLGRKGEKSLLRHVHRISEMANLIYIRQKEPLGLGHAVLCARPIVGEDTFAVILADDLIYHPVNATQQLWNVHRRFGGSVLAIMEVPRNRLSAYGIVEGEWVTNRVMRIRDMVEKPSPRKAPSRYGIVGRYILSPRIFGLLERTRRGAGGEIQLTDALRKLAKTEPVYGCLFRGTRYDAGDKTGYMQASIMMALRDPTVGPKLRAFMRGLARG